ncbi:MAG: hypothetical protein PHG70_05725, partial [Synergistaceae bacterium]|nr:hypothetical protein [Synergistaceae bacterium]
EAIADVNSAIKEVFGVDDYNKLNNVIVLENGEDYEDYLISEGYSDLIIEAISEYENNPSFLISYINCTNGQKRRDKSIRDYTHENGQHDALVDFCHNHKTKYALPVAKKITENSDQGKRIPLKVRELLSAIADGIGVQKALIVEDKL